MNSQLLIETPLLVKILNGPHEGAEMEIPQEGITLGSGDTCDLILFDPKIAARHFRLFPHPEGQLILSPLEGAIFLDGVSIKEDTVVQSPAQIITAGDTYFVTGAADQEWPEVTFPIEAEVPDFVEPILDNLPETKKKKNNNLLTILLCGAVIGIGIGIYFTAKKHPSSLVQHLKTPARFLEQILPEKSEPPKSSSNSLEEYVTQNLLKTIPNVVFSFNREGGRNQFDVWTRGEQATSAARKILSQASPPLLYNLIDLSQVETSATMLAQLFGISLQVYVEPEGIAFWRGYQRDEANWKVFFSHASRELPAIRDHRCQIVFGNRVVSKLSKELKQNSFNVRAVADEKGMYLEGSVPPKQKENWDLWLAQVRERYASQISIVDRVNSNSIANISLKEFFPSRVIGISGALLPWISLADGSKLFPGAKLKKGYVLEAITANTLQLSGPEGLLNFPLPTLE